MRIRSVSIRTSGRISGQGVRSGRVAFLSRLAHAAMEARARHMVVRINAARQCD